MQSAGEKVCSLVVEMVVGWADMKDNLKAEWMVDGVAAWMVVLWAVLMVEKMAV